MYRHLFFDLDNTFWDVDQNQRAAQQELYASFEMGRFFPDFDTYYGRFRRINDRLWNLYRDGIVDRRTLRNQRFSELLASAGVDDGALSEQMSDDYLRIVPSYNALLPHSIESLDDLQRKGYAMSLITNGFNEVQFHKVEQSGLAGYFQRIVTSEFAGVNKPNPGIFEYALRKAGVKAAESAMIGDDAYNDVYGAGAVGMDTVFYNPHGLACEQQPTYEIRSLLELAPIFP